MSSRTSTASLKSSRPSEHRVAYIHPSGEVEGFVGTGFSRVSARKNAISQVRIKLEIVNTSRLPNVIVHQFDPARLIESPKNNLTPAQLETVRRDWASGLRY